LGLPKVINTFHSGTPAPTNLAALLFNMADHPVSSDLYGGVTNPFDSCKAAKTLSSRASKSAGGQLDPITNDVVKQHASRLFLGMYSAIHKSTLGNQYQSTIQGIL
jgi:hypothetical protein